MAVLDLPSWTPSVDDVALRLIARTRQRGNGVLAKTFNSMTEPTDTDVTGMIAQAVRLLRPRLGEVPDRLADTAQSLATLKAAMIVEQSYFLEQIDAGLSPYKDLQGEYMAALCDWDKLATGDVPNAPRIASLPIGTLYPGYATGTY